MKKKTTSLFNAMAVMILTASLAWPGTSHAQLAGIKRTDLQQHDLGIKGREVVQTRVDLEPGILSPNHTHPGEEIVYVLEGILEYTLAGKPPVVLKAGDVLFIPAGVAHRAKNLGSGIGSELATYIVEKGKPLSTIIK